MIPETKDGIPGNRKNIAIKLKTEWVMNIDETMKPMGTNASMTISIPPIRGHFRAKTTLPSVNSAVPIMTSQPNGSVMCPDAKAKINHIKSAKAPAPTTPEIIAITSSESQL